MILHLGYNLTLLRVLFETAVHAWIRSGGQAYDEADRDENHDENKDDTFASAATAGAALAAALTCVGRTGGFDVRYGSDSWSREGRRRD